MELNNFKNEARKLRMTPEEKAVMKSRLFGMPSYAPRQSPYFFFSFQFARAAFAAVLVLVLAGGGTAYAAEGALPGSPLYAVKVNINEPVRVALAPTPAAKAAVNAQIAATRVEEAEALAQSGQLDATTSGELADSFEAHANNATRLAEQASSTDPSASVQIKAQLAVQAAVGGEVLAAIGDQSSSTQDREHAHAFAARVLAVADTEGAHARGGDSEGRTDSGGGVRTFAAVAPKTSAPMTAMTLTTGAASSSSNDEGNNDQTSASYDEDVAAGLETRAQAALAAVRAQLAASSTLDASTTAAIGASLGGIDTLIAQGSSALGAGDFSSAVRDFTQALSQSLRLSALLRAQQKFDHHVIEPLFNLRDGGGDNSGNNNSQGGGQNSNSGDSGSGDHGDVVPNLLNHF